MTFQKQVPFEVVSQRSTCGNGVSEFAVVSLMAVCWLGLLRLLLFLSLLLFLILLAWRNQLLHLDGRAHLSRCLCTVRVSCDSCQRFLEGLTIRLTLL